MGTIRATVTSLLLVLFATSFVLADEEDRGDWHGGFYEWVWGPEAAITVGGLSSNPNETDSDSGTPVLKALMDLMMTQKVESEVSINAKPLWEKDDPKFPKGGLDGVLIKSEPIHACAKVEAHPDNPTIQELEIEELDLNSTNFNTKWILIVDEGHCSIEEKMGNAEKAGYSAVLILSSDPTSDEDLTNISKLRIFAAKVAINDGLNLIENYVYPEPVAAKIEDIRDQQGGHAVWKIIGMVVAAILILISIIGIIMKIFKIRKRYVDEKESEELRETLRRTLETMPITVWELNQMTKDEKCHICYGLFYPNDIIRTMPCYHRFHQRCIITRFENGNTECPICHYQILTPEQKKSTETTPLL